MRNQSRSTTGEILLPASKKLAWGIALIGLVLFLGVILWSEPALADGPNRAGLVIRYGDGNVTTHCIEFPEPAISGVDLLRRSGLSVIMESASLYGGAVCKIDREGCDFPLYDCFCQCQGIDCTYWAYYFLRDDSHWEYANVGATGARAHNREVQGWSWGSGDFGVSGTKPPLIPFDQICAPPATSTPSPTATYTPAPTATTTPTPTPTATPSPLSIEFWAEREQIMAGQCLNLGWNISGATEVYLNGQGVVGNEIRQVCPTGDTTFFLRVLGRGGETTREVTVRVQPATKTPTPVLAAPATATPAQVGAIQTRTQPSPTDTARPTHTQTQDSVAIAVESSMKVDDTVAKTDTPVPAVTDTPLSATDTPVPATAMAALVISGDTPAVVSHAARGLTTSRSLLPTASPPSSGPPTLLGQTKSPKESGYVLLRNYGIFFLMAAALAGAAAWAVRRQILGT